MKLHQMIRKNCNGSSHVVVDNVIGTMLESTCSMKMIRVDEHDALLKCLEATENRYQVAKESNLDMVNERLRDARMEELENRDQIGSATHWNNASGDRKGKVDMVAEGKRSWTNDIKERSCVRRSGGNYEQFRREVSNTCLSRSHERLSEVVEAHRQI